MIIHNKCLKRRTKGDLGDAYNGFSDVRESFQRGILLTRVSSCSGDNNGIEGSHNHIRKGIVG